MGKIVKNVNFNEIPKYEQGTFKLRDQRTTIALFLSLSQVGKKVVFINCMHSCQENMEWSGSGVEQKSGISHIFNLLKIDRAGFRFSLIWDPKGVHFEV